jgi:hypothetical protein
VPAIQKRFPIMIGRLRFPFQKRTASAELLEDGRWRCPEIPSLVRVLDTLYSPRRDGHPADSQRARRHLHAAARWLKGTVETDISTADRN